MSCLKEEDIKTAFTRLEVMSCWKQQEKRRATSAAGARRPRSPAKGRGGELAVSAQPRAEA